MINPQFPLKGFIQFGFLLSMVRVEKQDKNITFLSIFKIKLE
jgi:hypothetical protein